MTDITVAFNGPQSRAYEVIKPGNTVCLAFGRGVGKSYYLRLVMYLLIAEWDYNTRPGAPNTGVRVVMLLPTLEQFRKVHLTPLLNELEGEWKCLGGKLNKTTLRVEFPGGSWVQVVSAEAAQGARGIRCDVILPDECDDIDPEVMESVTQPWFTEPHSLRITVLGGTPKRGRYGLLYRAFRHWPSDPALAKTHFAFHATSYDVPQHVDRAYIDSIRAKTPPAIFKREYLCDFDSAEGLVYDMFREDFHVRKHDPRMRFSEIIVGQDWGYEDAGCQMVIGIQGNGQDATAWVIEETYKTHQTLEYWVANTKRIRDQYRTYPLKFYADPSQPASIETIKRQCGVNIVGAENCIEDGVACVADRFLIRDRVDADGRAVEKYAKLYVEPQCENYIRELGLYRRKRDPKNADRILDAIEDKHNHANDAVRYALLARFGKPSNNRVEFSQGRFTRG